jgi:predicted transcriptional regulator
MMERPQVNIRLDRRLLTEIDELAEAERIDRSEMARRLLDTGMSAYRSEMALREYRRGSVTAWKAAEMAGTSLYEMLDRIHTEGIPYEVDPAVFDNLDALLASPVAAREQTAAYGSDTVADASSGIAELRQEFRPEKVAILFVGESSPAGGTHFYRGNSNLFRATRQAFATAYGEGVVPDGPRFLHWFRERGCWLVDVADRPVNRLPDAERRQAVLAGGRALAEVIRDTAPERIVAVKASIGSVVREAAAQAEFAGEIVELPFPVRQWRQVYVQRLADALRR